MPCDYEPGDVFPRMSSDPYCQVCGQEKSHPDHEEPSLAQELQDGLQELVKDGTLTRNERGDYVKRAPLGPLEQDRTELLAQIGARRADVEPYERTDPIVNGALRLWREGPLEEMEALRVAVISLAKDLGA